jgi:D-lactate dehydrogenase
MKIGFFGLTEQWKKEFFQEKLSTHQLEFFDECLKEGLQPESFDFDIISIFVECKATEKVLQNFPNLKFIAIRSTGFDNVDLEYCSKKNIKVSNVPSYGSHTVAEFTFALLLALSRNVYQAIYRIREQKKFDHTNLRGFDLSGKTIGIIGTGKIGTNVIKIAKGFEMKVIAFDAYPNQQLSQDLGFEYTDLDNLLSSSDIVTLHAPYNKDTRHLLNKQNIPSIKKGAYLINTSRGGLIETEALFQALNTNQIAGIALDVIEEENQIQDSPVDLTKYGVSLEKIEQGNIILTPHTAFFTKEAEESIQQTTVDNIEKFTKGNPQNLIN